MRRALVALSFLIALPARAQLVEVAAPVTAACDDLDLADLITSIETVQTILKKKKTGSFNFGAKQVSYAEYGEKTLGRLAQLAKGGKQQLCAGLKTQFTFYKSQNAGPGKFTAYQNPEVHASRTKKGAYKYPLYKRPPGALAQLTTAEIQAGGLDGKGLELLWFSDPTEVNLVHVEGSATVVLDDGSVTGVSSEGHNGHPYQNVSKLLVADKKIPKDLVAPLGMTRARRYFQDHTAEFFQYWAKNPHYVFFHEVTGSPAKSRWGELLAHRAVAVDPTVVPQGAAAWIKSEKPVITDNKVSGWTPFSRVVMMQDTGSGIKGPGRVDVYYGRGVYAMAASAVTDRPGEIYVILAK